MRKPNYREQLRTLMENNFIARTGYPQSYNEYLKCVLHIDTTRFSIDIQAKLNKSCLEYCGVPPYTTNERNLRELRDITKSVANVFTPPQEYDFIRGGDVIHHDNLMVNIPSPLFDSPFIPGISFANDFTPEQQMDVIHMLCK